MYRHKVVYPEEKTRQLAELSAEAAAFLAELNFIPRVHFFVEDPDGRYPRPVRAAGFVDYRSCADHLDAFVRDGLNPREIAETTFHEAGHIATFSRGDGSRKSHEALEREAREIELLAPIGDTVEAVTGELARKLVKVSLRRGDIPRARRHFEIWREADPEEASTFDSDVLLSPSERRLKIQLEAQQLRREVESAAKGERALREFREWRRKLDANFSR